MMPYIQLVKRNILIFLRDKGAVFFSFLSMLIVICLMVFFLGDVNISTLTDKLALLPNRDADSDRNNAFLLVLTWTIGGIIPVNAVMVTLSAYSAMIKDKISRRLDAICTAPVSRGVIAMSYITAACAASIIICTLTFAIAEVYCVIRGVAVLSAHAHVKIFFMIIVNSFTYSAIMYLCAALVKSEGAWSGLGTGIGALVGFFGGIYMPIGELSATLASILKCTPVIYSTVMFRQVLCEGTLKTLFNGVPSEIVDVYKETMGITINVMNKSISPLLCSVILIASGIVFLIAGMAVIAFTQKKGKK